MPPKMLTSTAATGGPAKIASRAACATSERAPPPMSQKSAALPPAAAIWSMVLITRPAPLPMTPMSPSSGTNARPAARALASRSSSGASRHDVGLPEEARCRRSVTLLSRQTISPPRGEDERVHLDQRGVAVVVERPQRARTTAASALPAPVPPGSSGPNARRVDDVAHLVLAAGRAAGRWGGARCAVGSRASRAPRCPRRPRAQKMSSGPRTSRETVIARYSSRAMSTARSTSSDSTAWPRMVMARMSAAAASTSAAVPHTRMPPALPRPPVLACALTQTCGPSCSAARRASVGRLARRPTAAPAGRPRRRAAFPGVRAGPSSPPSLRGPARGRGRRAWRRPPRRAAARGRRPAR